MEIKKANLNDLQGLQDIGIRSYLPHYTHLWKLGGVDWYLNRCFGDKVLQDELTDPNVEYYIVSVENQSIGILKSMVRTELR